MDWWARSHRSGGNRGIEGRMRCLISCSIFVTDVKQTEAPKPIVLWSRSERDGVEVGRAGDQALTSLPHIIILKSPPYWPPKIIPR